MLNKNCENCTYSKGKLHDCDIGVEGIEYDSHCPWFERTSKCATCRWNDYGKSCRLDTFGMPKRDKFYSVDGCKAYLKKPEEIEKKQRVRSPHFPIGSVCHPCHWNSKDDSMCLLGSKKYLSPVGCKLYELDKENSVKSESIEAAVDYIREHLTLAIEGLDLLAKSIGKGE